MKNVSVRLKKDFVKEAEQLAELESVDKSIILREALEKGIAELRLETAIKLFSKGKVTTSEAAEIAGLSVGEMMDRLVERGLKAQITKEEIKGSLATALKNIK